MLNSRLQPRTTHFIHGHPNSLCSTWLIIFVEIQKKGSIYAMGMDKKLQCLVGLTWWNLLQCTWGEAEWPGKPAGIFQDNLIEEQIWQKFSNKSFPAGKSWWSVEVWLHFDTAQQQKRSTLHLTPCALCSAVHNGHYVEIPSCTLPTTHRNVQNTLYRAAYKMLHC